MIKKMVILAVVGFVAVSALSGTKIMSYIRSELRSGQKELEDSIPPEKELARLKSEVEQLDADGKKVNNQLAKAIVEARLLQEEVDALATAQAERKADIQAFGDAIKSATEKVSHNNTVYSSAAAAKAKLEADVAKYKAQQAVLSAKEEELKTRISVRDDLAQQREKLEGQKTELKLALSKLEAQIIKHRLKQTESKVQTDDSRLAKIKADMDALQKKLDIKDEELKLSQPAREVGTPAPQPEKSVDDILKNLDGTPKGDKKSD
jgi:chromosome segregation ATPase